MSTMSRRGKTMIVTGVAISTVTLALTGYSVTVFMPPGCDTSRYKTDAVYTGNSQWRRWWASPNKGRSCEVQKAYGASVGGLTGMSELETDCNKIGGGGGPANAPGPGPAPANNNNVNNPPPGRRLQSDCTDCVDTDYGGSEGHAARFNTCMSQMSRFRGCVPHVDCDSEYIAHQYTTETFNYIVGNDGSTLCPYIDRENFLSACEARIAYADQRDRYGWLLVLTMGLPALLWVAATLRMACAGRGVFDKELERLNSEAEADGVDVELADPAGPSVKGSVAPAPAESAVAQSAGDVPNAQPQQEGGASKVEKAVEKADATAEKALQMSDAVGGSSEAQMEIAKQALRMATKRMAQAKGVRKVKDKWKRLSDNAWWKTFMFVRAEVLELVTQFLAFSNPSATNILEPLLLGSLITVSAFVTPVLFVRGHEAAVATLNGTLSLGYLALALPGLFGIFNEVPDPSGMVSFSPVLASTIVIKCVSAIAPLLTFAVIVMGMWSEDIKAQAAQTFKLAAPKAAAAAQAVTDEASRAAATMGILRKLQLGYLGCSWVVGALSFLAVIGVWDCGTFRTCQLPPCSVAEANLPFGIPEASLPFETHAAYSTLNVQQRLRGSKERTSGPADQRTQEWNWEQRSNLKVGYKLNKTESGTYMFTLTVAEQGGGGVQRQVTSQGSGSGSVARQVQGQIGACVASFHVQCQEASPRQSLRDQLGPIEFVRYRSDTTVKLVLADPKPACWTATSASDSASGWWLEHMLFGPSVLAGRNYDGTGIEGLVVRTGECKYSSSGGMEQRCVNPAPDVIFYPDLGRNPIKWSDWTLQGGGEAMPQSWSVSSGDGDFRMQMAIGVAEIQNGGGGGGGGNPGGNAGNNGGGGAPQPAPDNGGAGAPQPAPNNGGGGGGTQPSEVCTGHQTACAPKQDKASCESTPNPLGGMCTWGSAGGPSGPHCAGEAGCELNNDQTACNADTKSCNWNP
jgi:hypothetical protein